MRGRIRFMVAWAVVGWTGCGGGVDGRDTLPEPGTDLAGMEISREDAGDTASGERLEEGPQDIAPIPEEGSGWEEVQDAQSPDPGGPADSGAPADGALWDDQTADLAVELPQETGDEAAVWDPGLDPGEDECRRDLAPADRSRWAVVSLPYGVGGARSQDWTLLRLETDGSLTWTGDRFQMGRATGGVVAFTPDGRLGIAAQDDGTLGVFALEANGSVRVVDPGYRGGFYADQVRIVEDGRRVLVLDAQWAENGGGLYLVEIRCDGTLVDRGRWIPARLPRALLPLAGGLFLLAAWLPEGLPAEAGDVHLYDLVGTPTRLGGGQAFPQDAIIGGAAATPDGSLALLGDVSEFSGRDTAIAVMEVQGQALVLRQRITPFEDPVSIVAAPQGGTLLAASGYGDALWVLERASGQAEDPIRVRGRLATPTGKPQLPGAMVIVERGPLAGRVLVAEVTGVRQVHLGADGSATDLGVVSLGGGVEGIPGALGIEP